MAMTVNTAQRFRDLTDSVLRALPERHTDALKEYVQAAAAGTLFQALVRLQLAHGKLTVETVENVITDCASGWNVDKETVLEALRDNLEQHHTHDV